MSVITEVLDRLSGIAVVRAKLEQTTQNVDKLGDWVLDHEKRLTALETQSRLLPAPARKKRKKR